MIKFALALMLAPAAFAQTSIVPDGDCGAVTLQVRGTTQPVSDAYVFLPRQRVATQLVDGRFKADIPAEGVVMVAADFKPESGAAETRTEHAKALVFCGDKTPEADWQRSTGIGFEIYPQGWNGPRPTMKPGDAMRFIAVDRTAGGKDKLLGDLPMKLYGANGWIADGVPAQYGGMNFPYQKPGRYTVVATWQRPDPENPQRSLVDTSTLTFDIK